MNASVLMGGPLLHMPSGYAYLHPDCVCGVSPDSVAGRGEYPANIRMVTSLANGLPSLSARGFPSSSTIGTPLSSREVEFQKNRLVNGPGPPPATISVTHSAIPLAKMCVPKIG